MLEVGKLYRCSEYFLSLFPNKETAATASITAAGAAGGTAEAAATAEVGTADASATCVYWTRKLGKPVSFCDPLTPLLVLSVKEEYIPLTPLLVLSVKEEYIQVLAGNQKGWIIYRDWLNIKEIVV